MREKPAWTNEEIVRHYREAKDRASIVDILAELNGVTVNCIRRILLGSGIEPERKVLSNRQRAHLKVMLVRDGNEYTVEEVARMHRCSEKRVQNKYRGRPVCQIDGAEYKVIGYKRRG